MAGLSAAAAKAVVLFLPTPVGSLPKVVLDLQAFHSPMHFLHKTAQDIKLGVHVGAGQLLFFPFLPFQ